MQKEKLLREVCEMLNVSRRAVQGYEQAGLVESTGKNKYGYLLYNEETVEKIRIIKQYQNFGFCVKEIKTLLEASEELYLKMMSKRLEGMYMQLDELTTQIKNAKNLIEQKKK